MKRLSWFASVIVLGTGTAAVFHPNPHPTFVGPNENIKQMTDGAFRDGLYLGRLAAEHGAAPHVVSGRWTSETDRASFTAGYQRGYKEFLASRVGAGEPWRQAE